MNSARPTIIVASILFAFQQVNAFCPPDVLIQMQQHTPTVLSQSFVPFADATEPKNSEPIKQIDVNGKVFSPGATVAIAPNTKVKAHQVPKDAYGSFDPVTRDFVPADESNMLRSTSCLVLSEGIRGEVTKVYDVNEWDRAHPILVQFEEGIDREGGNEGFDLPKAFMMHFSANEIIVVD